MKGVVRFGIILLSNDGIRTIFGGSFQQALLFLSISILAYLTMPTGGMVLGTLLSGIEEMKLSVGLSLLGMMIFIARDAMIRWGRPTRSHIYGCSSKSNP
jgi:O-antigen/teichoic acid export membrane protein